MPGRPSKIVIVGMLASVMVGMGCHATAPGTGGSSREYVPAEIQPGPGESIVSESTVDTGNRYLAAVVVDGGRGPCSGVLVAPRLVLTAGHCVCSPHPLRVADGERRTLIDTTACSPTATIKVVTYGQSVTLVGYGDDGLGGRGLRRSGFNEVASIEESGTTFLVGKPILFRQPYKAKELLLVREKASYSRKGDSGGPCFREKDGTVELVGIAKTYYGSSVEVSEYTSVYSYEKWIRSEIARTRKAETN